MLGFPLLYFKGMRLMMFQLSSFYCKSDLPSGLGFSHSLSRSDGAVQSVSQRRLGTALCQEDL